MPAIVTVDVAKCDGKGECVETCPVNVFALQNGKSVVVAGDECVACMSCVEVCPHQAITVQEL